MNLKLVIDLLRTLLRNPLNGHRFTGTINIKLHCREGSVGKCEYKMPDKWEELETPINGDIYPCKEKYGCYLTAPSDPTYNSPS